MNKALWGAAWAVLGLLPLRLAAEPIPDRDRSDANPASPNAAPRADTGKPQSAGAAHDLLHADRLTGEWGGLRPLLEDVGIRLKIEAMNQFMANLRGGRETTNGHDFAGSYDFNLYFDFDRMQLVPGGLFFIRGKGTWGGDGSDFDREKIGALFKTNQDSGAEEPIFVDKWWWRQRLWQERLEFRLGRQEPVKDLFDTSTIMGHEDKQFLNRALVRNATLPPDKGLGAFVRLQLPESFYVQAAALDAHSRARRTNFDTAFHDENEFRFYGELGWRPMFSGTGGPLPGHYRLGCWYDPTRKAHYLDDLDGLRAARHQSDGWGLFTGFDQMIWKESDNPEDPQGLSLAARYGHARGLTNRIEHFWAVAAQYTGPVPGRDRDVLSLGMAQAILSDEYREVEPDADRETVYELYYALRLTPWLTVSPDFQYITNAGGNKSDPHAAVFGIRLRLSL